LDAIACGLPVVTLPGRFMRSRMTCGFLQMMGLTETIAKTEEDYISIAVKLGLDAEFRKAIKDKTRARRGDLYSNKTCVRALEDFYREAIELVSEKSDTPIPQ